MKNKIVFLLILICMSIMLTGCVDVGNFYLTEEQEKEIVDYSATILLKHNKNTSSRIVDTSAKRMLLARVEANKQKTEQMLENGGESDKSEDSQNTSNGEATQSAVGEQNIARALHQDEGIEINYKNFEVCSSYPCDGSSDGFFAMDATMGNELLVFHFEITNLSSDEKVCNLLDVGPLYRMIINDNDRKNALTTLLMNDMATINETIGAGESKDAVVILETPAGYSNDISSVKFLIKVGEEQSIIPIN